jgi:primosomal protein N' (replication factor Y)
LGLVVVDEEHAESYKQDRAPRYHARDVAVVRARQIGGLVVLGSATPSVETYWRSGLEGWGRLDLPRRVVATRNGSSWAPLPAVEVVDMRAELRAGNRSILSRRLDEAIAEALAAGDQAILYLNRRGGATHVSCRACGFVVDCPRCRLPLTYHPASGDFRCHHCNHRRVPPMMCPDCGSRAIRYFGAGTERVESDVTERYPDARVLRFDSETTRRRGSLEAILDRFAAGEADVLIGTQMLAKGLDMPGVTLVGIVSADTSLHLPDPWARERTFQLLTQVAGRAGRSERGGTVVLQTYRPEEPAIRDAANHDYAHFYECEVAARRSTLYPPFSQLIRLELDTTAGEEAARQEAAAVADRLRLRVRQLGLAGSEVVGPAPAFFYRTRGRRRWQVVIRSTEPAAILADQELGRAWHVDVDPVSLL